MLGNDSGALIMEQWLLENVCVCVYVDYSLVYEQHFLIKYSQMLFF